MKARLHDYLSRLGVAAALFALAACSGDANPIRDLAVSTGAGVEPKPGPDFVASSRPAQLDYIQPGIATRSVKAKSAEDVKAFEARMEKTRAANEGKAAAARQLGSQPAPSAPATRPTP